MEFSAEMIAGLLSGEVVGDGNASIYTVSSIEGGKEGGLAYLSNPRFEPYLYTTKCSIVLVERNFEPKEPVKATLIKVDNVNACVLRLLDMYNAMKPQKSGISKMASISEKATIGENCYIGDFAVIEAGAVVGDGAKIYPQCYVGDNVKIGAKTTLYAGVKIYEGCSVGANCILHAGSVIGADGFGFAPNAEGGFDKIPQLGNVIIEDNVEIGAGNGIDGDEVARPKSQCGHQEGEESENFVHCVILCFVVLNLFCHQARLSYFMHLCTFILYD